MIIYSLISYLSATCKLIETCWITHKILHWDRNCVILLSSYRWWKNQIKKKVWKINISKKKKGKE